MTAPMLQIEDDADSSHEWQAKHAHPPAKLRVGWMLAIVVTGIAVALIAQSVGLSFRLSIVLSALVVGVSIPILHYVQH
jgi:heme/copper-type cytochrome/quinol oxidase subunit 4